METSEVVRSVAHCGLDVFALGGGRGRVKAASGKEDGEGGGGAMMCRTR